jgi:hypothetical protein
LIGTPETVRFDLLKEPPAMIVAYLLDLLEQPEEKNARLVRQYFMVLACDSTRFSAVANAQ